MHQVLEITQQAGYVAHYIPQLDEVQIELEPRVICIWCIVDDTWLLDASEAARISEQNIVSVHYIGVNYHATPLMRRFLKLLFQTYGG
jgi:hypothetical protein